MTVINQVQQTLAGIKSAQASFETFALQTDNQQAAQRAEQIVDQVNQRMQQIQQEEPQYSQNQVQQQNQ